MGKIITYLCQGCGNRFVKEMVEFAPVPRCPRCQGKNVRQR